MAPAPAVPARPYRRILTSALHRRFVHASAFALLVSYVISFLISTKTSLFWSWFPLGACGFRTLLLFISSLSVFVLRVGQLHVGAYTTVSPFQTWRQTTFSVNLIQTFGWPYERARLNEKPIYLHCFYFLLALTQATFHLYYDWDQLVIPIAKRSEKSDDLRTHPLEPPLPRFTKSVPKMFVHAVVQSGITAVVGPLVYTMLLRRKAWNFTLYFARLFWHFSKSAEDPPGIIPPIHITLLLRSACSGTLLIMLWQTSNLLFSVFLGRAPLKKGLPLTNTAKDPNGSLINGLKAKKAPVLTFALWELCLISQQFPDRRKGIFNDIDRAGGSAWSQVFAATSDVIKGINSRITQFQSPTPAGTTVPTTETKEVKQAASDTGSIQTLPRLTLPPKEDNIFLTMPRGNTRPEKFEAAFGSVAKSYGHSPDWTPSAKAKARQLFDRASSIMLSPAQKRRITESAQELKLLTSPTASTAQAGNSAPTIHPLLQWAFRSRLGAPFRKPYARRLRQIVLGSPFEQTAPLVDATEALTKLFIASLTEDQFGKVQNDVPTVVRLFTETILTLESFVSEKGLNIHWTDVEFPINASEAARKNARRVEEVELVLCTLRTGLSELLTAFRLYLREVGVVGKDLQLAKQAAVC
ncbi:predicted protein [Uncinocarpus reesii 1704]|uniref:Nuclear envelope protein n=1 Tax=Uncinocarpus reesii (strain UAMH 1704) TaxID=336963 RepID=C4JSZ8_UNCRE|nr:uncharacterized protein UREG_05587 [Uncinocarpus reesii 1704]EEP80745.1 predicted protein [Uncinocarpus reesii 1704]